MMGTIDFPLWFQAGSYGGLICCVLAIIINMFLAVMGRQDRTRRAIWITVVCVLAALLLLPTIIWFQVRFNARQGHLKTLELSLMLIYVALCGWIVPLGVTLFSLIFAPPSSIEDEQNVPVSSQSTRTNPSGGSPATRAQSKPAPYVFSEETPWAWLEFRGGKFQGQRLALKRTMASMGRDEQCDIWIDDEMASRYHAELSWDNGLACLTDRNSLNGTRVNGRRVRGTILLSSNDVLEIGEHTFLFLLAEPGDALDDDPLSHHTWRSTLDLQTDASAVVPITDLLPAGETYTEQRPGVSPADPTPPRLPAQAQATFNNVTPPATPSVTRVLRVMEGSLSGRYFVLERPLATIGQDSGCDWILPDTALAPHHARMVRRPEGDYIEDLTGKSATLVNEMPLWCPQLLKPGDVVGIGNLRLEYTIIQTERERVTPLPPVFSADAPPPTKPMFPSSIPRSVGGPQPLRLPSKRIDAGSGKS